MLDSQVELTHGVGRCGFPALFSGRRTRTIVRGVGTEIRRSSFSGLKRVRLLLVSHLRPLRGEILVRGRLVDPRLTRGSACNTYLLSRGRRIDVVVGRRSRVEVRYLFPKFRLSRTLDVTGRVSS